MGMIRGKIESPREVTQDHITLGNPVFREVAPGKWVDIKTGEPVEVQIMTLDEFMSGVSFTTRGPRNENL